MTSMMVMLMLMLMLMLMAMRMVMVMVMMMVLQEAKLSTLESESTNYVAMGKKNVDDISQMVPCDHSRYD